MKYPILKERTQAVWDYLKDYMLSNDGRPPATRDFLRDNVHNLTSTSLVQYHLEKLEAVGLITMIPTGSRSRRIEIKGAVYRIPRNIYDDIILTDDFVRIEVDNTGRMLGVIDEIFKDWEPPADKAVIVTDNPNVAMIAIGFGITFPNFYRVCHQLAHGGLEIIIAHDPAGDTGGAGAERVGHCRNKQTFSGLPIKP